MCPLTATVCSLLKVHVKQKLFIFLIGTPVLRKNNKCIFFSCRLCLMAALSYRSVKILNKGRKAMAR